ncbi:lipoyl synthase [Acidimicrobiaceae bacterium]|nr:lipoyl synthase [Acidimicrobiaceae bacterium]
MRDLNIRWLGKLPYSEAYDLQLGLHRSVSQEDSKDDYLLLLEHNNVITSGRSSKENNLLVSKGQLHKLGIEYFETDRGGDITYHGDGQLIGYPIIRLSDPKKVIPFVRNLENVIIDSLRKFKIDSFTKEDDTGVWTAKGKIASVGIKVSKWTTYHGFSLNIFDSLDGYQLINPCGNQSEQIASIHQFNPDISFEEVASEISDNFAKVFGYTNTDKQFSQFTPRQLKRTKEFNIDQMVKDGVFKINQNKIPVTVRGVLPSEPKRPEWMKVKANLGSDYVSLKNLLSEKKLNTVCEEASCPNIYECWSMGTATFMIMGDVCTRACGFCDVKTGKPGELDLGEPLRVAESVQAMNLTHAVITSVNRDDLEDGGSMFFADTIRAVKDKNSHCDVEVLVPDFKGLRSAIQNIIDASPEVFNHNLETVPRLQREIRTAASYGRSLSLLEYVKKQGFMGKTKTGLIVGMGETKEEVISVLKDLSKIEVDIVTIGQYLRPTAKHRPIDRYATIEEFEDYKIIGESYGIPHVESGPLVRSSYHAKDSFASA